MQDLSLPNLKDTKALAEAIAQELRIGDVVLLAGQLGAGKTTLAQYLIDALCGEPQGVTSPTFTLVQTYPLPKGGEVWHYDLYRIQHAGELIELGLDEAFTSAITLIEWPERLEGRMPSSYLQVTLCHKTAEAREAVVSGVGEWRERLGRMKFSKV